MFITLSFQIHLWNLNWSTYSATYVDYPMDKRNVTNDVAVAGRLLNLPTY